MESNQPVTPPSVSAPAPAEDRKGLAIAGFVLSILSLCGFIFAPLGLVMAIVALILSILGVRSSLKGLAIAGIVISALITLGFLVIVVLMLLGPVIGNVFSTINESLSGVN